MELFKAIIKSKDFCRTYECADVLKEEGGKRGRREVGRTEGGKGGKEGGREGGREGGTEEEFTKWGGRK